MSLYKRFTLIELLVCLSVITIISALLLPALNNMKEEVEKTACLDNQKQLGLGLVFYTLDNNGYFPNSWRKSRRADRVLLAQSFKNYGQFYGVGKTLFQSGYLSDAQVFQCPSRSEYGSRSSFDDLPAWGSFFDMDYADKYLNDKWLYSSYMFKVYEWEQINSNALFMDSVNSSESYKLLNPDRPMASDYFIGSNTTAFVHQGGQNVLYEDGSAHFVEDETLYCGWLYWEIPKVFKKMWR